MADRLQRRRRRRKRVRWLAVMDKGCNRDGRNAWYWSVIWGSIPPPRRIIAIYDTGRLTDGT